MIDVVFSCGDQELMCPKKAAGACRISRRTFDRWVQRSAIVSTRALFAGLSVARAIDIEKENPKRPGAALGGQRVRSRALERQCIEITDETFSKLVKRFPAEECAAKILSGIVVGSDRPSP